MPFPFVFGAFFVGPLGDLGKRSVEDINQKINEILEKAGEASVIGASPTVEELLALERIRRKRFCPDRSKLLAGGAAVQRHLEYCDACRARLESFSSKPKFTALPKLAIRPESTLEAGQVRDVAKTASGLIDVSSDEWLFNPPMVLVIQTPDADRIFVRVAQMHNESELAGPGDIPVTMPDGNYFIESWNTYPMLSKYLGPVLGTVDPDIVKLVVEGEKKGLPDVPEDTPLESFRELETRISYFFCRESVLRIMDKLNEKVKREKGTAKVHPFIPPVYNGKKDDWNKPLVAVDYCRSKVAAGGFFFPFPIAACVASVAGAIVGVSGGKLIKEETKDKTKDALEPLEKYVKDASKFRKMVEILYSENGNGSLSTQDAIKNANFLYINAEKAANAVLYLAAAIAEKVNNGEISENILLEALGFVKKSKNEVVQIEKNIKILNDKI